MSQANCRTMAQWNGNPAQTTVHFTWICEFVFDATTVFPFSLRLPPTSPRPTTEIRTQFGAETTKFVGTEKWEVCFNMYAKPEIIPLVVSRSSEAGSNRVGGVCVCAAFTGPAVCPRCWKIHSAKTFWIPMIRQADSLYFWLETSRMNNNAWIIRRWKG